MNNLDKEIQKKIDFAIENIIFPEFNKIAKKSVNKNYYKIYNPIYYKRRYRFQREWKFEKENGKYKFFIDENVGFKHKGKFYYLPEVATNGGIKRNINGVITFIPIPFISKLRDELKKNKIFMELLKKYGLIIE